MEGESTVATDNVICGNLYESPPQTTTYTTDWYCAHHHA